MRNVLVTLLSVAVLAGIALVSPGVVPGPVRDVLGIGPTPLDGPTLRRGEGEFRFLQHQPGAPDVPVTYDPCRPIPVEVNTDGLDDEDQAERIVRSAIGRVREASGLKLEYAGTSTRRPQWGAGSDRAGDSGEPVLISFADSDEVPALKGRVAAIGGSTSVRRFDVSTYVTGQVTLDVDTINRLLEQTVGEGLARAIALHELGHLVGLGHVVDRRQLMSSQSSGLLDFGPGDLRGLAELGRGPCR